MTLPTSFNSPFVTGNGGTAAGAEAAWLAGAIANKAYLNIHTTRFPGGEIRSFLVQAQSQSVPEPGSLALLAWALVGVAVASRGKGTATGTGKVAIRS